MPENATTSPDLIDPNGRTWHPTDRQRAGHTLYVIHGVDATHVPSLALSTKDELEHLFDAPMTAQPPGTAL